MTPPDPLDTPTGRRPSAEPGSEPGSVLGKAAQMRDDIRSGLERDVQEATRRVRSTAAAPGQAAPADIVPEATSRCPGCGGSGTTYTGHTCGACGGNGFIGTR